jgi:MFS family permease
MTVVFILCDNHRMNTDAAKRYLPWVVATTLFMEQLDSTVVNTAIPAMAASLQVTPLSLKAVVTSYILSLAVSIPISGWMADRYGTRRVFMTAIAIFTIASVLCGLSVNSPMLVAARLLQGFGAAMMMPVGRLTIVRTYPKHELLAAMNFVIIPALIGPLLGPTIGGLIVHWLTWRDIFFINVPVGLVAIFWRTATCRTTTATITAAGPDRPRVVRHRHRAAVMAAGSLRRT